MDYFKLYGVFPSILSSLQAVDSTPLPLLAKECILIIACSHYKKYDGRNPALDQLSTGLSGGELLSFNESISNLFRMSHHLNVLSQNKSSINGPSPALSPSSSSTSSSSSLPSSSPSPSSLPSLVSSLSSSITSAFSSSSSSNATPSTVPTPSPSPTAAEQNGVNTLWYWIYDTAAYYLTWTDTREKNVTDREREAIAQFSKTLRDLGLYLFYTLIANNPKFLVKSAKLRREKRSAASGASDQSDSASARRRRNGGGGGGDREREVRVVPTECPSSLSLFLTDASLVFAEKMNQRGLITTRLCLVIFRIMSEDTACNIVLHDTSLKASVDIVSLSLSFSASKGLAPVWKQTNPDHPLIVCVFGLITDFLKRYSPRLLTLSQVHLSCFLLSLDSIYRFICFQLQSTVNKGAVSATALVPSLSLAYIKLANVLVKIISVASKCKASKEWDRIRDVCHSSSLLLRVFLCLRDSLFHSKHDTTLFLYELTRHSAEITLFYRLAQRKKDGAMCAEIHDVATVAALLSDKVKESMSSLFGGSSVTTEQVIGIIDTNSNEVTVGKVKISGNFPRFIEAPGQNNGEVAFFDLFVNNLLRHARSLYLDPDSTAFTHIRKQESVFLTHFQAGKIVAPKKHFSWEELDEKEEAALAQGLATVSLSSSSAKGYGVSRRNGDVEKERERERARERERGKERREYNSLDEEEKRPPLSSALSSSSPPLTSSFSLMKQSSASAVKEKDVRELDLGVKLVVERERGGSKKPDPTTSSSSSLSFSKPVSSSIPTSSSSAHRTRSVSERQSSSHAASPTSQSPTTPDSSQGTPKKKNVARKIFETGSSLASRLAKAGDRFSWLRSSDSNTPQ